MTVKTYPIIRQEEAAALIAATLDPRTSNFARSMLAALWRHLHTAEPPASDFDLAFFMRVVIDFGGEHELLESILRNDEELGWPD